MFITGIRNYIQAFKNLILSRLEIPAYSKTMIALLTSCFHDFDIFSPKMRKAQTTFSESVEKKNIVCIDHAQDLHKNFFVINWNISFVCN